MSKTSKKQIFVSGIRPSVGLVIITTEYKKDGELVVVLRRRSAVKYCDSSDHEPWAGAHVVSAHGKRKWEETPKETLERKSREQLGDNFFTRIRLDERDIHLLSVNDEKQGRTYGVCVHPKCISSIQIDCNSAGFILFPLSKIHIIRVLAPDDRNKVIANLNDIAMHKDEIQALLAIQGNKQLLAYLCRCCK